MARLAVIGGTGAVGVECLRLLDAGVLPVEEVLPVATGASVGRDLGAELGLSVPVRLVSTLADLDLAGLDAAVFCAGAETSKRSAEKIAATGVLVVDNSSAFRERVDVPLVVPEVNAHMLRSRPPADLVANPNCSTIQMVRVLHPLHLLGGLEQVVVATYQAASGGGRRGLAEFAAASAARLADPLVPPEPPGRFGQPLAFNVVPEIGLPDDSGFAHEERKLASEPRKILDLPDLRISATAVRVPVFDCHSEAVYVRMRRPVEVTEVEEALGDTPGLRVYRRSDRPGYPMPRGVAATAADRALVHVGRIRVDPDDEHALWLWIVADNLWVGAALNALRIVAEADELSWWR